MNSYITELGKELESKNLSSIKAEVDKYNSYNLSQLLTSLGYENQSIKDFINDSNRYLNENGEKVGDDSLKAKYIDETKNEVIQGCFTRNKEVIFLLGLPGSGKSSSLNEISKIYGERKYYLIDADDYKSGREDDDGKTIITPLADKMLGGIDIEAIHELSSEIAKLIVEVLAINGIDIALPKVGDNYASIKKNIDNLKTKGYKIYVHFLFTTVVTALKRNLERFINSKSKGEKIRLVPAKRIFDMGYMPLFNFFKIVNEGICDDYGLWSGENCEFGKPKLLFKK